MAEKIRLTQTVQKGGCAAKVAATELRSLLGQVRFPPNSARVLVDGQNMDDAGVVLLNADQALVQTLDFFTPIVDSPYLFGQIAAANALSDVYAMGGRPATAMAILAFPVMTMETAVIAEILQGAADKIQESGADFVGGHSIDDETIKFGLSVSGYVHPQRIWKNTGAQAGDRLILTKPIGTGTATAALKRQTVNEEKIADVLRSMCQLNNVIEALESEIDLHEAVNGATDITGFGLAGHAMQMAKASQKSFRIQYEHIPFFSCAYDFIQKGYLTKAHRTNFEYVQRSTEMSSLTEQQKQLLVDPQTSGGLMLAVKSTRASALIERLQQHGFLARDIGEVLNEQKTRLVLN